jgi:hypothetical protein
VQLNIQNRANHLGKESGKEKKEKIKRKKKIYNKFFLKKKN